LAGGWHHSTCQPARRPEAPGYGGGPSSYGLPVVVSCTCESGASQVLKISLGMRPICIKLERLIFTQCGARVSRTPIADPYEILDVAGVEFVRVG
jgi:hypothetical protein